MTSPKVKSNEIDEPQVEEKINTCSTTTPLTRQKRNRDEEITFKSSRKYIHRIDGNNLSIPGTNKDSLTVPFWKQLNDKQLSFQFQTKEIGSFSLLNRADEKQCFDDKRYLRGKYSFFV